MSDNYTYSRPYAEAAFKIALEENTIDLWSDSLRILSAVISDGEIKAILANPKIESHQCISLLSSFLSDSSDKNIVNFIKLLMENKRIFFINEISEIFEEIKSKHNKVLIAEVESSYKLTSDQLESLTKLLENKFKSDFKVEEVVNADLIAGIRVKVNDHVIDLSLQNKLEQMKQQLII